jgi:Ca-activated chloride channel family protein
MAALPDRKDHINAVVVLTDGDDTSSRRVTKRQLIARLTGDQEAPDRVRVYTIAYQPQPSFAPVLDEVAAAGGGQSYRGNTDNIESIYTSVSSFF